MTWGQPQQLHSDQGKAVDGWIIRELCGMMNIEKTRTTPYHPSGDGQVERYNQTLMHALHAYASKDTLNWDDYIGNAVLAYNSTRHSVTGFEPNRLMISRNVYVPEDLMVPDDPRIQPQFANDYINRMAKEMRFCYALVRERLQRAATAMKRYYDRKAYLYPYTEGDAVRLRKFRLNKGTKKFEDYYDGPYYVIDVLGETTFRIAKAPLSRRHIIHHDAMLPFHNSDPEKLVIDNAWVFPLSRTYKPSGRVEVAVQTEHWRPPPEEQRQPQESEALPETTPKVVTDKSKKAPYKLRIRLIPREVKPSATPTSLDQKPRKRGRPRKIPASDLVDYGVQTRVQVDIETA